jgi:hypothetical protein
MVVKDWVDLSMDEKIERWEHADLTLKNLSPHEKRKHFDLGDWGTKGPCGTVACVAGHCGMDPWFRRRGFKLDFEFVRYTCGGQKEGFWQMKGDIADDAFRFFGSEGYYRIFTGTDVRGEQRVSDSRKAIQRYLKELREQKASLSSPPRVE